MSKEVFYTSSDLWLCALFLCESNAKIVDVQVIKVGRETVTFSFCGENLTQLARAYCANEAKANVTKLRKKMNGLRDLIFAAKNKN